jgi:hypothetical protein
MQSTGSQGSMNWRITYLIPLKDEELSQINDCGDRLKFISIISAGFSFSLFFQVSFRIVVTLFLK